MVQKTPLTHSTQTLKLGACPYQGKIYQFEWEGAGALELLLELRSLTKFVEWNGPNTNHVEFKVIAHMPGGSPITGTYVKWGKNSCRCQLGLSWAI